MRRALMARMRATSFAFSAAEAFPEDSTASKASSAACSSSHNTSHSGELLNSEAASSSSCSSVRCVLGRFALDRALFVRTNHMMSFMSICVRSPLNVSFDDPLDPVLCMLDVFLRPLQVFLNTLQLLRHCP